MVVRWLQLVLALAFFVGCSLQGQVSGNPDRSGQLYLPLETTSPSGTRYRLTNALLRVTSDQDGSVTEVSTEGVADTEIRLTLEAGDYLVELSSELDEFTLLRLGGDAAEEDELADNAELISSAAVEVEVLADTEVRARFRFLVDGEETGFGDVVIGIDVEERNVDGGAILDAGAPSLDASIVDGGGVVDAAADAGIGDASVGDTGDGGAADAGDAGPPVCGDGVVNQADEDCDDGNDIDTDECSNTCEIACVCGDLVVCAFEDCDDGNLVDGDSCPSTCRFETDAADAGVAGGETDSGSSDQLNPECNGCLDESIPDVPVDIVGNCLGDPQCVGVMSCVVDSNCFQREGSPSVCYCGEGTDINACQEPDFVPPGACVDELVAAFVADGLPTDNATIVGQLAADGTTSGAAFVILIGATNFGICIDECSL